MKLDLPRYLQDHVTENKGDKSHAAYIRNCIKYIMENNVSLEELTNTNQSSAQPTITEGNNNDRIKEIREKEKNTP